MFTPNERDLGMNILDECMRRLDEYGVAFEVLEFTERPNAAADLIAKLDAGSYGNRTYAVEIRRRMTAAIADALPRTELPLLIVAPYVSREAAEVLRDRHIDFVDPAGNMALVWPAMRIHVVGQSKPPAATAVPTRAPRAFGPAGAKVLFTLLSWDDAVQLPLRTVAERSGVSLGTAHIVVNELESAGYVVSVDGARRLMRGRELLDRWTESFSTTVVPKLASTAFVDDTVGWWQESWAELAAEGVQLGGEAAGSHLDSDLHSRTAILYTGSMPRRLAAQRRWRRSSERSNIVIRQRFWAPPEPISPLVPSTLIYADMWTSGDSRQRAHAERIRESDPRLVEIDRS
ncbi:type IV toxin-antitoxin system AbiEi family antitoxin [Nocardia sp. NPDC087230]|uniref:type IV toxin-antitoxin system AbiEi family antitoxin n=1 Tax=Nocardia sp. NPDC087230 TaxID=3364331 RepID=UPI0037FFC12D